MGDADNLDAYARSGLVYRDVFESLTFVCTFADVNGVTPILYDDGRDWCFIVFQEGPNMVALFELDLLVWAG